MKVIINLNQNHSDRKECVQGMYKNLNKPSGLYSYAKYWPLLLF